MSARFGSLVVLRDLVSKPELNGLRGTIKSLTAAGDRCEVVVEGAGAQQHQQEPEDVQVPEVPDVPKENAANAQTPASDWVFDSDEDKFVPVPSVRVSPSKNACVLT